MTKKKYVTRAALTVSSVLLLASTGAAQVKESVERVRELSGAQSEPAAEHAAFPARAGEAAMAADTETGERVVASADSVARLAPATGSSDAAAPFTPLYYHAYGNSKVSLPSRDSHVCALHKLQGVVETNAMARVRYFEDNTQELGNLGGNTGFSSTAACVPKYKFFNNSANPISKIFPTKYWFVENGSTSYNEEWGNAAAMLTGIGGPFRSLSDRAWVWQEPVNARNVVDIVSDGPGNIIAYSTAFWFNESSGPQKGIKFIGPYGTGSAAQAGEYFVGQSSVGAHGVSMAHVDQAFCYLTGVNGELSQQGDTVQIYLDSSTRRYVLWVNKSNPDAIHAYARCMAFDQR